MHLFVEKKLSKTCPKPTFGLDAQKPFLAASPSNNQSLSSVFSNTLLLSLFYCLFHFSDILVCMHSCHFHHVLLPCVQPHIAVLPLMTATPRTRSRASQKTQKSFLHFVKIATLMYVGLLFYYKSFYPPRKLY